MPGQHGGRCHDPVQPQLCIEHGKPSRAHVGHAAPIMYCALVPARLGHDDLALAVAVWEAVYGLFRARMRAAVARTTSAAVAA